MGKAFSTEFRNMIVELHLDYGKPIKGLAMEYAVSASTINRWVVHYRNKGLIGEEKLSKGVPFDSSVLCIQNTIKRYCLQRKPRSRWPFIKTWFCNYCRKRVISKGTPFDNVGDYEYQKGL